ncbi:unnamed protein product [Gordionus sp. m RMFG-2023]
MGKWEADAIWYVYDKYNRLDYYNWCRNSNVLRHHTIPFIRPNLICLPFDPTSTSYHSIHSTKSHLSPICPLPFIIIRIKYN